MPSSSASAHSRCLRRWNVPCSKTQEAQIKMAGAHCMVWISFGSFWVRSNKIWTKKSFGFPMSKNADPKDKGLKDQKDPCRTVPEAWSMWPYCPDFSEKGLVVRKVLTLQDGQMPLFHVFLVLVRTLSWRSLQVLSSHFPCRIPGGCKNWKL